MRRFSFLVKLILLASFGLPEIISAETIWVNIAGIKESDIKELSIKDGQIYAASEKKLYKSEDNGKTWQIVFSIKGDDNAINFIENSDKGIFVCTNRGVYTSADGLSNWKRIFKGVGAEENSVRHIAFLKDEIYLGTKNGLFISKDNTSSWQKDPGEAGGLDIRWIAFLKEDKFLAAETGVYKKTVNGWKRVFVIDSEEIDYDPSEIDADGTTVVSIKPVNSIFIVEEIIYLASDSGIFISRDRGESWERFIDTGLLSQKVKRLLFKNSLYAATDKGVFMFLADENIWKAFYQGMPSNKVNTIAAGFDNIIWAATDKGLYVLLQDTNNIEMDTKAKDILHIFDNEPGIKDVQDAAIKYAEVHPDKIKRWREAVTKKALLPKISIGLDRYITDYWHWDSGTNPDTLQKGKDAVAWDVTMSWDMSELIWSDSQTSIDTRSRLMVQLRDDILDEVTRTYFERRRLQIEMYLAPPLDIKSRVEKELRIEELTADLDGLTGGYFSNPSESK